MIARHESFKEKSTIWSALAAPISGEAISWRQDGRIIERDGRHLARFVAYIEANTVRERLDSVVPGEWDLTLELLPTLPSGEDGEGPTCSFKARLQVLGVVREDVGTGRDYKSAATDAFKRAGVRFGIGHELYAYEQNWVEMDGDGRNARPLEDPAAAYERKTAGRSEVSRSGRPMTLESSTSGADAPSCPKCGGRMWDNRATKRNPRAPDFKCRDRSCDGVVWPTKSASTGQGAAADAVSGEGAPATAGLAGGGDDLPF